MVALVEQVRGSCAACGARWVGAERCHCAHCCATYDTELLYEAHRLGEICRPPQAFAQLEQRLDVWCQRTEALPRAI